MGEKHASPTATWSSASHVAAQQRPDTPRDHCGIVGVSLETGAASYKIHDALFALQHRGQDSAGIATFSTDNGGGGGMRSRVLKGLVEQFDRRRGSLDELRGSMGIGHVRYCTAGSTGVADAQPVRVKAGDEEIALAFNGNVANVQQLRDMLRGERRFNGNGDGEVLAALLASHLRRGRDIEQAFGELAKQVDGAYSIVALTSRGELAAFRDPHGIRPFSIGRKGGGVMFSSESVALDANGFERWRDMKPGEMALVSLQGSAQSAEFRQVATADAAHCMFEFVYFSRPDSVMEGRSVSAVRRRLGEELARTYASGARADLIVPVPDTSRTAAEGISEVMGLPIREGLIKNRYIHRTFILPTQEERRNGVRLKLNADAEVVRGRDIILVDDSIVRGTTIKDIVQQLRRAGAGRIEVWITSPPLVSPCFYGIDISNHNELMASHRTSTEELAARIGADRLCYQTMEGLKRAIGLGDGICTGCLNGVYVTPAAQRLSDMALGLNINGRITENKVAAAAYSAP